MFFGAKRKSVGATVPALIPFWLAEAMSAQFVKRPKFIEPQLDPVSWFDAYTRCLPLYGTCVKSLSETQPDFGFASEPVDVQRYVDGRLHDPVDAGVVEVATEVETLVVEVLAELVGVPVHGIH
jgi:hypothetical protein